MAETEETAHLTTVRRQWKLRKLAAARPHFKAVNGKFVPYKIKPPEALDIVIAGEKRAQKKAATQALENLQIGQATADGTIYLGQYQPKDREGNTLGEIFNVYAAPEDLPDTMRYVDAVEYIAGLKDWHGFNGTNYATDKETYAALKDGSYNGGWIIPTREFLAGKEAGGGSEAGKGAIVSADNLFDHQNKGAFKGTFCTAASNGSDFPDWYRSSTEQRGDPSHVWAARFADGGGGWCLKDGTLMSCRPVRLELVR